MTHRHSDIDTKMASMKIEVKTNTGKNIVLDIHPSDPVENLKLQIEEKGGLARQVQDKDGVSPPTLLHISLLAHLEFGENHMSQNHDFNSDSESEDMGHLKSDTVEDDLQTVEDTLHSDTVEDTVEQDFSFIKYETNEEFSGSDTNDSNIFTSP